MNGFWSRGLRASLIALTALLLIWGAVAVSGVDWVKNPLTSNKSGTGAQLPPVDTAKCDNGPTSFTENESYRMQVEGLSKQSAKAAKADAVKLAETNPVFVSGLAMERKLNGGGYIDARKLVDGGCWTTDGYKLSIKVQGLIEGASASLGKAPKGNANTGGKDGQLTVDKSGIRGNRDALVLTHEDGSKTYILLRCGNVTLPSPPKGTPEGPTDNPPPKKKPKCPAGTHGTPPVCKDGPERQRTNADGAGPNHDSGPGAYIPSNQMDRPAATPRPDPTTPAPRPGSGNSGSGGSTPQPEPTFTHPDPEPSAPKPDKSETGCKVIPGTEDC